MLKKQKSFRKKASLLFKIFFRKYPSLSYILRWLFISLIISVCIGSASAFFLQSLSWVTDFREKHFWVIFLLPIGGFVVGMLYYYCGKDVEAGNNLLIDTIHNPKNIIPLKMAPFVYFGTIITHWFGGSAGREGTALQMAGAIADQFSKPLHLSLDDRKVLIIAAVAGGFGSVFGTPLAGAIFAIEFFLIGKLSYKALYPAFITSILADTITKMWHVSHAQYHIDFVPQTSLINILYTIIAGVFFGLCALCFSKLLEKSGNIFKAKISYPPLRPFIGGIMVIIIVLILGTTKYIGLGIPVMVDSFSQQLPAYDFLIKMILTVLTLSAGFKGGEVTPLFFIGATLGNALCLFIPLPMALLAGIGFVAVFAGATNTPIACTIMGIELFGVECGVYVAIACVISYLISGNSSIYRRQMIGVAKYKRFSALEGKRISEL